MKIRHSLAALCLFSLALVSVEVSQAQYTTPDYGFGARADGLGGAFLAEPYDIMAMYWNPGAIAYLPRPQIALNHVMDVTSGVISEDLAVGIRVTHKDLIAIGVSVDQLGYVPKEKIANFRFVQYGYDLAYAREVVPTLSLGARVGLHYGVSGASNLWAAAASVGLCYFPSPEISYGASVNGLGTGIRYDFDGYAMQLNRVNAPRSLQVGAMVRFPPESKEPVLTLAIANEKVFGVSGLRYKGGLELQPYPYLALRIGYQYANQLGISAPKYGMGFHLSRFHIDYSISPSNREDQTYNLSLLIDLWNVRLQGQ